MNNTVAFRPLKKDDLAEVLGISQRTVDNWVTEGVLPAPTKLGNRVYWHPNVFYAWLDLRLAADPDESTLMLDTALATQKKSEKSHAKKSMPAAPKSEMDRLRNRAQAKLDALLN